MGIAKREPALDLSAVHATGLAAHIRAAVPLYTPLQNDPVSGEPGIDAAVTDGAPGLDAAWRGAILHHPGAWLAHRFDVFRWIAFPPDVTRCTAVYTGVDGPPELMEQLNIKSAWRPQDIKLAHYAEVFVRTPSLQSRLLGPRSPSPPWPPCWRRGRPDAPILALMLGAALAYAASFLVIGIACDHRYLYVLDVSAMAALLRLACDPPARALWRKAPRNDAP